MDGAVLGVIIVQGVAFVGTLLAFAIRAGRVLEKLESHEQRITRLEKCIDHRGSNE
jgi:hypothetical protein